ncbi:MAG: 16S rRNA (uracil(1498)-N(3))-methyltransferase [Elusimicrobia bacterium]|nr:16S rRNA (uracil(1498)-N(3))-methyltransferase [Elusimicrobiota bacterium]
MKRFFIENITGDTVVLTGSEAHHLKNVLRKKTGDMVFLFDGKGSEFKAEIVEIIATKPREQRDKLRFDSVRLKIISKTQKDIEPRIKINLYQSIPKLKKFDFILEKSTELGVSKIIPVMSERTQITQINPPAGGADYADKKQVRWQKIVLSASKQCGRTVIPEIAPVVNFDNAVKSVADRDYSLIFWESETKVTLKQILKRINVPASPSGGSMYQLINVFVGPEGGFSIAEIELAGKNNIMPVSLGKRILRTETAPIVVISNILYELDL